MSTVKKRSRAKEKKSGRTMTSAKLKGPMTIMLRTPMNPQAINLPGQTAVILITNLLHQSHPALRTRMTTLASLGLLVQARVVKKAVPVLMMERIFSRCRTTPCLRMPTRISMRERR